MKKLILIVGVIIIVVLICSGALFALSVRGVATAQQNSRDSVRRNALQDAAVTLSNIYAENGEYPKTLLVTKGSMIMITGDNTTEVLELEDVAQGGNETTEYTSVYCYTANNTTYKLGVKLENGNWFDLGSDKCSDNDKLALCEGE